jgi:hypothetical protein
MPFDHAQQAQAEVSENEQAGDAEVHPHRYTYAALREKLCVRWRSRRGRTFSRDILALAVASVPIAVFAALIFDGLSLDEALTGLGAVVALAAATLFWIALQLQASELRLQRRELKLTRHELKRQHEETAEMKEQLAAQNSTAELDLLGREVDSFCMRWMSARGALEITQRDVLQYISNQLRRQATNRHSSAFAGTALDVVQPLLQVARAGRAMQREYSRQYLIENGVLDLSSLPDIGASCSHLVGLVRALDRAIVRAQQNELPGLRYIAEDLERLADRLALTLESDHATLRHLCLMLGRQSQRNDELTLTAAIKKGLEAIRHLSSAAVARHNRRVGDVRNATAQAKHDRKPRK